MVFTQLLTHSLMASTLNAKKMNKENISSVDLVHHFIKKLKSKSAYKMTKKEFQSPTHANISKNWTSISLAIS